jgi:hypothetical protein
VLPLLNSDDQLFQRTAFQRSRCFFSVQSKPITRTFPLSHYTLGIAANAAGMTPRTYRRLIDTNILPLRCNDLKSQGSGDYIGLSRNRILQAATTQYLHESLHISLSAAAQAALTFSDESQPGRAAGDCFAIGKTLLVVRPTGTVVINPQFGADSTDLADDCFGCTFVDCGKIAKQVDTILNTN